MILIAPFASLKWIKITKILKTAINVRNFSMSCASALGKVITLLAPFVELNLKLEEPELSPNLSKLHCDFISRYQISSTFFIYKRY